MRIISRAENWERVHEAFQQINFSAWDYVTIKESLLDYLKLYYPEDFNDLIESSELIAFLELFAYVGELLAYRLDLNAHENFITTAERKESVLRLAKLLSYNASRNIAGRGLVKITSVSTTKRIFDSRGNDLSNKTVLWNDPNNLNWKEQFLAILNPSLEQPFGTVLSSDRVQVQDVLFELYKINNNPLFNNVIAYKATVSGNTLPMEIVSSKLNEFGPFETRPERDLSMSLLFLNDGLGDSSENTGFFFLTKQGTMGRSFSTFDGVTPNQSFTIDINNINETDVWVNNIDPDTGEILVGDDIFATQRIGEWEQVDLANAQNIIFNTNPFRNKYEIETLNNDRVKFIFGDGKFAAIPSGRLEFWYRSSANDNVIIPTSAVQNVSSTISYRDDDNKEQTLSFTFSLVDPIQNAAPSEDIEHIRRIAPSVYFTQDRMVNGRDYNVFPLKDNTILKLRSINRTFAGDSKFISWKDPREFYDNVKLFGDDLVFYFNSYDNIITVNAAQLPPPDFGQNTSLINALIDNFIEPIFSTEDFFITSVLNELPPIQIRKEFNSTERIILEDALQDSIISIPNIIYLNLLIAENTWVISTTEPAEWLISIQSNIDNGWTITLKAKKLIAHSDEIRFWTTNIGNKVIEFDTQQTHMDEIVVLKANLGITTCALLQNYRYKVLRQDIIDVGENSGLHSIHDLNIIPLDENLDGIPDVANIFTFINPDIDFVYFNRENEASTWIFQPVSAQVISAHSADQASPDPVKLWKRETGKENVNFLWMHRTPRNNLIDPSASNIIDMFIIPRGYHASIRLWLSDKLDAEPEAPTNFQLRSDYSEILENKMISDTVILHPGKFKILFGKHAKDELKAVIKIVRSPNRTLTSNQIKTAVVNVILQFFDINKWEFGETFYFTELASFIHNALSVDIDSVVLVPSHSNNVFGDLYQVFAAEDEIIQPSISVNDIEIVESLNPKNLRQII